MLPRPKAAPRMMVRISDVMLGVNGRTPDLFPYALMTWTHLEEGAGQYRVMATT
jgi:hypothetical protein